MRILQYTLIPLKKYETQEGKMKQYIKKETRLADFDPCPRFIWNEGLSSLAISVYTLLLGRVSLSKQNDMIDEQGRVYVIYTVKHMAEKLSRSEPPIYAALKSLEEKGLIEKLWKRKFKSYLCEDKTIYRKQK